MDLTIVIPARNEMFLGKTIEDILEHSHGDTEVTAVLDGYMPENPLPKDPRVNFLYFKNSIGQRAATNRAVKMSRAKWIMKCDAHCAFADGFDVTLINDMQPNWTQIPTMRNLWAFNWVCKNGHTRYQGPSGPCKECGESTEMDICWIPKTNPSSRFYRFDKDLHFQYWGGLGDRRGFRGRMAENMSAQGSCFMISRERYIDLDICDEKHGSWGQQGTEVACKTWLSDGGMLVNNNKTWYAHMFRTQGGDFGFPYPLSGKQVDEARRHSRRLFMECQWEKMKYPLSWLLKRFWPIPGWDNSDLETQLQREKNTRFANG